MLVYTPFQGKIKSILKYCVNNYNTVIHLDKWQVVDQLPDDDEGIVIYDKLEKLDFYRSKYEMVIFIPLSSEFEDIIFHNIPYRKTSAQNYRFRDDQFLSLFPVDTDQMHVVRLEVEHIIFNIDIIAQQFLLLSGYDEIFSSKDHLERITYQGSLIEYFKLHYRALADEGFVVMLFAVQSLGVPESFELHNGYVWKLTFTHDIDHLKKWTIGYFVRLLFFKRYRKKQSLYKIINRYIKETGKNDPYIKSIDTLLDEAKKNKIVPIFFLRSGKSDKRDSIINYQSDVVRQLDRLSELGKIKIGIHPSIHSASNLQQMKSDWQIFSNQIKNKLKIVRQHFLMYDVRRTPIIQNELNYSHDYSVGFHDHEGFRRATVHPFFSFDFKNWRSTHVLCVPLIAMDTTFVDYRNLTSTQAAINVKQLIDEVVKYQGSVSLLIHNTVTETENKECLDWYREIIAYAKKNYGLLG